MRVIAVLLALAAAIATVRAQTFRQVFPTNDFWSPRGKGNIEYVKRTSTFRCLANDRTTSWTNIGSYFLFYGGQGQKGGLNDVWVGRPNGLDWCFASGVTEDGIEHSVNAQKSFNPSVEQAHCQDSTYKQYRAGGRYEGQDMSDVWSSADGAIWTQVTDAAPWDPRYLASMISDYQDRLIITGGITSGNPRIAQNDAWRSTNGGRTWIKMESQNENRPDARGVAVLLSSGSIWNTDPVLLWMTGVDATRESQPGNNHYLSDVWASRNSGRDWTSVTLAAGFGRRDDANAEITPGGLIVMAGGYTGGEILNDVWVSANGGYSWGECVHDAEWDDRRYLHTVLDDNGLLWVMGGEQSGGFLTNDIWKSVTSYYDTAAVAQSCGVSIPSCGTGLKCWPGEAETLVSTDGRNVYCSVCPYGGSSGASQLVTIFLVIFILAFLATAGLLGYTYYKLRSAGAPSPIPLPASAQRWWNKSTAGAVGGTTDAGTTGELYQALRIRDQV